MKNRALLSVMGIALALAACEGRMPWMTGGGPTPTKVCDKNGPCQIKVTVAGCAAGGTQISLDHEVAGMKKGDSDINIHWQLMSNQYEFPQQAITFSSGEFGASSGSNKNNYFVRDRNSPGSGASPHKYTVTVVKAGGAACAAKDPIIINDYVMPH